MPCVSGESSLTVYKSGMVPGMAKEWMYTVSSGCSGGGALSAAAYAVAAVARCDETEPAVSGAASVATVDGAALSMGRAAQAREQ